MPGGKATSWLSVAGVVQALTESRSITRGSLPSIAEGPAIYESLVSSLTPRPWRGPSRVQSRKNCPPDLFTSIESRMSVC
ncbi:UNVERIFIED_CONTAM: hypothetical protein PYX00_008913 [Menopon gallinae]|uniref:Secreted protein n=1 Tax=Menopon gallinae TaxID=328185 RepID=A0AAW2H9D0_9NEOP